MSTIVAVEKAGRIVIAADSMSSMGSTRCVNVASPAKVHKVGASFIASAGFSVYRNVLQDYAVSSRVPVLKDERSVFLFFVKLWRDLHKRYHLVDDQVDSDDPAPFADVDAEFVVINRYGIFRVSSILCVSQITRFCAIGSGAPHAEGALHILYDLKDDAEEIARLSVDAALAFDCASGGPVTVTSVDTRARARAKVTPRKPARRRPTRK